MRITIGHLLILFMMGAGAFFGFFRSNTRIEVPSFDIGGIKGYIHSLTGLFKSGQVESAIPDKALASQPTLSGTALESSINESKPPIENAAVVEPVSQELIPTAVGAQASVDAVVEEKPVPVVPTKRKRTRRVKTIVNTAPVPDASSRSSGRRRRTVKPAAASAANGLVGSYVSLKLKSGREVKGILDSQTTDVYRIQLPGMGPFEYAASDVVDVKAIE